MQPRGKARVGAAATGAAAMVSIVLVPVSNYASEATPAWARNPGLLWTAFVLLAVASAGLSLLGGRWHGSSAADGAELTPISGLTAAPLNSLLPPHVDRDLVRGREAEISALGASLRKPAGRFAVVCGAGGFGKTTVAAALAQQARSDGYAVFWIRWRDVEDLAKHMTQIALACGLREEDLKSAEAGHVSLPDLVWGQLRGSHKWLLVIDNADQAEQLNPPEESLTHYRGWIRPDGGGLLVVTSRDTSAETWGGRARLIGLDSLDPQSGAQMLCDSAPDCGSPEEAESLAARLGGLPLALHAVGAYLTRGTSRYRSFTEYQSALDRELASLLGARHPHPTDSEAARRVVRHTWEVSLDQLDSEGLYLARPLMRLLSLFSDAPIALSLIDVGLLRAATGTRVKRTQLEDTLFGLERYGLLGVRDSSLDGEPEIQLHSLVREITALSLTSTETDLARWKGAVVRRLVDVAETVTVDRADWPAARAVANHAQCIFENRDSVPAQRRQGAKTRLVSALYAAANYAAVVSVTRSAYASDVHALGTDHPQAIRSRFALARALNHVGQNAESARIHREILEQRADTLGPQHYRTVQSRHHLAIALSHLGHIDEAIGLFDQVLEQRRRTSGVDTLETIATRNDFAHALNRSGRHGEAVRMHREILDQRVRLLGPDQFRTMQSRHNVATAMDDAGQHAAAAEMLHDILEHRTRTLGPEHPHTIASRNNLGRALSHLGRHAEAVELLQQVLEQRGRILGPDHPQTLFSWRLLEEAMARGRRGGRRRVGRWPQELPFARRRRRR